MVQLLVEAKGQCAQEVAGQPATPVCIGIGLGNRRIGFELCTFHVYNWGETCFVCSLVFVLYSLVFVNLYSVGFNIYSLVSC